MEYKDILEILAPCGLNCRKCFAFFEGEISTLSKKLQELLGAFDRYAERFSLFLPVFKNYPSFKELLAYFAQSDCKGCRVALANILTVELLLAIKRRVLIFVFNATNFLARTATLILDLNIDGFRWIIRWRRWGLNLIFKRLQTYLDTGKAERYGYV